MANLFQGPIPGQSLTDSPRNAPWERPSEYDTVEDVVKVYVNKLADQDVMDDIAVAFQLGADLKTLTETMMLSGAMKGVHTVEAGMLAGPVVATFIKVAMKSMGVDVPETAISFEEQAKAKEKARLARILEAAVEQGLAEGGTEDAGSTLLKDIAAASEGEAPMEEAAPVVEEKPAPSMGKGLMARGGNV